MRQRGLWFLFGLAVLFTSAGFGLAGHWPWARLSDIPTARPLVVRDPFRVVRDTLQRGETVTELLRREGITRLDLSGLASTLRFDPRKIKAGLIFLVRRDIATDSATHVEFRPTPDERLRFVRTASGDWKGEAIPVRWSTDTVRIQADIRSNLYEALDRGVSDATLDANERTRLTYQLADVNAYTLDFSRDLQPGDVVTSVVERQISQDGEVRFGRVLASRMEVHNKVYDAYGFPTTSGEPAYYDARGNALKRAFLVSPVDFRYISSNFSLARFHPILGLFRKHEGIDYAASAGSPVRAAGDGVVAVAGPSGGYGNMIEIRHRDGVSTRYGHLSSIAMGIRPGMRVSQGEVIGRVGMTGLATAPHLHYEFRVAGVARDPRSIKSEPGAPLVASALTAFQHQRALLDQLLGSPIASAASPVTE